MLIITGLYTALTLLLAIVFTAKVIDARRSESVSIGDGGSKLLATRMRGHANLIETAPLFLIGLAALELNGANPIALHALGVIFMLGRILHAVAFLQESKQSFARRYGMIFSLIAMLVVALYLIGQILLG